ncbi:hypothetical protein DU000_06570 [Parvibium lacunae]|uniref:Uncharacterized protein n=1 Tax=Parvibium lacunae TaxID=1888893 RepID=A0A368L5Q3_9BURK|nr:hypothetical protein DU000_06570 [Parvibium lacunae]
MVASIYFCGWAGAGGGGGTRSLLPAGGALGAAGFTVVEVAPLLVGLAKAATLSALASKRHPN